MLIRALLHAAFVLSITAAGVAAQSASDFIAAGDRESAARQSAQALALYERAVAAEPRNAIALWKASRELVDLGEAEQEPIVRDGLYARAVSYAKRAIAANPNDAEAQFHAARAVGQAALTLGPRDRVRYATDVRNYALRSLELAPRHAGALHVMGVWNAEIMRLSGMTRLIAKTLLGAKSFDSASWTEATRYMELSVSVEPQRVVHRLDLARVYRDSNRKDDARQSYTASLALPSTQPNDDKYKREAEAELKKLGK